MPLGPLIKLEKEPSQFDRFATSALQAGSSLLQGYAEEQANRENIQKEIQIMMQIDPNLTFQEAANLVASGITAKDIIKGQRKVSEQKELARYKQELKGSESTPRLTDQQIELVGFDTPRKKQAFRSLPEKEQLQEFKKAVGKVRDPGIIKNIYQSITGILGAPPTTGPYADQAGQGQQMNMQGGAPPPQGQQMSPTEQINQQIINQIPGQGGSQMQGQMPMPQDALPQQPGMGFEVPGWLQSAVGIAGRFGEGLGGIPLQLAKQLGSIPERAAERMGTSIKSEEDIDRLVNQLQHLSQKEKETMRMNMKKDFRSGKLGGKRPNLLEEIKKATPPRNVAEEIAQDIAGITGSVMSGGKVGAGRALKAAGLGKLAEFGAKSVGAGPLTQGAAKLITTLGVATGFDDKVTKQIGKSFDAARKIGKEIPVKAKNIYEVGKRAFNEVEKIGEGTSSYESVKKAWDALQKKLISKEMLEGASLKENAYLKDKIIKVGLEESKTTAATIQDFIKGFKTRIKDVSTKKDAKDALIAFKTKLTRAIENPSNTSPEYASLYKQANKAWTQIKDAESINDYILNVVPKNLSSYLPMGLKSTGRGILKAGGAVVAAGAKGYNALKLLNDSAIARKAYAKMVQAAVQENPDVVRRSAQEFVDAIKKELKRR